MRRLEIPHVLSSLEEITFMRKGSGFLWFRYVEVDGNELPFDYQSRSGLLHYPELSYNV